MSAALDEGNVGGYSVAYGRDDIYFPVYITAALALIFSQYCKREKPSTPF